MKTTFLSILVCFYVLFICACSNQTSNSAKKADSTAKPAADSSKTKTANIEYDSPYICPSHCKGSGSEKAGTCKTCGMEYIENVKKK